MKKEFKFIKIVLALLGFISIFAFKNISSYANEMINEVDCKKEWVIKFNKKLNPITVNNKNIMVKDSNGKTITGLNVYLLNDGQTVKVVSPCDGYKELEVYTLIITTNIYSDKGNRLKNINRKKFKIKKPKKIEEKTSIIGNEVLSAEQMGNFVLKHNSDPKIQIDIYELAKIFLEEGKNEGIRGDIAFCQSIKETGYFKYGGQVLPEQNNYAGIGALNNEPVGLGAWFKDPREGVRAQIQHLKGYATYESLKNPCVDPRYDILKQVGILDTAHNWEDLNGKWAVPGKNYGEEIIQIYKKIKE